MPSAALPPSSPIQRYREMAARGLAEMAQRPRVYRRKLLGMALLGHGYLLLLLGMALGGLVGMGWALAHGGLVTLLLLVKSKLGLGVAALGLVSLRGLWVRIPPPEGLPIPPRRFPRLVAEVEALRRQVGAPPVHRILLSQEFNASMAQTPRLGLLGWYRNTLVVGLPLMACLSPEQLRAVLAHELGHLSHHHGRFTAWIYRTRSAWMQAAEVMEESHFRFGTLFWRFHDWFIPRFSGYSLALARDQEYQADAFSAATTSPRSAAEALLRTTLAVSWMGDGYHEELFRRTRSEVTPPDDYLTGLAEHVRKRLAREGAWRSALATLLLERDDLEHPHPALKERLAALGVSHPTPGATGAFASEHFLGEAWPQIARESDTLWREENRALWAERHQHWLELADRQAGLLERSRQQALSPDDHCQLAQVTEWLDGEAAARPLYQEVLAREPAHPTARFALGRMLLAADDPAGLAALEGLHDDLDLGGDALVLVRDFHRRRGEEKAAERVQEVLHQWENALHHAWHERQDFAGGDRADPPDLPQETVDALARQLVVHHPRVKRAWLARKRLDHFPEQHPLFLLLVRFRWFTGREGAIRALLEGVELPGGLMVVAETGETRKESRHIRRAGVRLL